MNKEQIWVVLECCLLISDGVDCNTLKQSYGFNEKLVNAGKKLHEYLQSLKVEGEIWR